MEKQKIVYIKNEYGLHARPAAQLAKKAADFHSEIFLHLEDFQADARSVLDILSLAASQGKSLTISAKGPDAEEAIQMVENFFSYSNGEY